MSTSQTSCGSFKVLLDAIQTETTYISLDILPSSTETECTGVDSIQMPTSCSGPETLSCVNDLDLAYCLHCREKVTHTLVCLGLVDYR